MKLIHCTVCLDTFSLPATGVKRICTCKSSWGTHYHRNKATYGGKAVPLGISDLALSDGCYTRNREKSNTIIELTIVGVAHERFYHE